MDKDTLAGLKNLFGSYDSPVSLKDTIKAKISYFLPYSYIFICLSWIITIMRLYDDIPEPNILIPVLIISLIWLSWLFMYVYFLVIKYPYKTKTIAAFKVLGAIHTVTLLVLAIILDIAMVEIHSLGENIGLGMLIEISISLFAIPAIILTLIQFILCIPSHSQICNYKKSLIVQPEQITNEVK